MRARAGALGVVAALSASAMGCALNVQEPRFALYRGGFPQGTHGASRPWQDEFSHAISARFVPVRRQGATVGGEIETSVCFDLRPGCDRPVVLRNGSLLVGWTVLPGYRGRFVPGFDFTFASGLGEPAGPLETTGTRLRLGASTGLVLPLRPFDVERGYVVLGEAWEVVLSSNAGFWSPPTGSTEGGVLFENSVGLALRVRIFSDMLSRDGYPRPTRLP